MNKYSWLLITVFALFGVSNIFASDSIVKSPIKPDNRPDSVLKEVAQKEFLLGNLEGVDHAAESIYGTIKIAENLISWRGCKTQYSIVLNTVGNTYPDEDKFLVENVSTRYVTLKLKLKPAECLGFAQSYLQFSFSTDIPSCAKLIEYDKNNHPEGRMSFCK